MAVWEVSILMHFNFNGYRHFLVNPPKITLECKGDSAHESAYKKQAEALIPLTGRRWHTDGLTDGLASKHMPSYQQKQRIKILKNMSQLLLIQFFLFWGLHFWGQISQSTLKIPLTDLEFVFVIFIKSNSILNNISKFSTFGIHQDLYLLDKVIIWVCK